MYDTNTYWKVAYSTTCKRYEINTLSQEGVENLQSSIEQMSEGEQFLGLFSDKETAYILYERLLNKRNGQESTYEEVPFFPISKAAGQTLSFDLVLSLICAEFGRKPDSYLQAYCRQYSLPYKSLSYLLGNPDKYLEAEYHMEGPLLVSRVLFSLGYIVTMSVIVVFDKRNIEEAKQKVSYYFIKKTSSQSTPISIRRLKYEGCQ